MQPAKLQKRIGASQEILDMHFRIGILYSLEGCQLGPDRCLGNL